MAHRFSISDIAMQSGLSEATVDRVINQRGGVRAMTEEVVYRAIDELDRQHEQWHPSSRSVFIDVIMWTPQRFSTAVREALESVLNEVGPGYVRARFDCRENWDIHKLISRIKRSLRQETHGVILKVPNIPEIAETINHLAAAGLPVMTLVTDVNHCQRLGYIGIDNYRAGATAAYLLTQWVPDPLKSMAIVVSSNVFQGEVDRETGFKEALVDLRSHAVVHSVTNSDGLDQTSYQLVHEVIDKDNNVGGIYSIGGGNFGVIKALEERGMTSVCTIGHDLVRDNILLLKQHKLSALIHHNLREDMRQACKHLLAYYYQKKDLPPITSSKLDVITPYNIPPDFMN